MERHRDFENEDIFEPTQKNYFYDGDTGSSDFVEPEKYHRVERSTPKSDQQISQPAGKPTSHNDIQPDVPNNKKGTNPVVIVVVGVICVLVTMFAMSKGNKNDSHTVPDNNTGVVNYVEQNTIENTTENTTEVELVTEEEREEVSVEVTEEVFEEIIDESKRTAPFYGIWIGADKDEYEANQTADKAIAKGINAKVFLTTDWSNLNTKKYYVITAGVYETKEEAKSQLDRIIELGYEQAYVKYSGEHN